jgi:hypothetical protein
VSIYLYTRERPAGEIAPVHGTFYVQRPLPEWVRAQHVLSEDDCKELRAAADRRDKWIEFYQNLEVAKSGQIAKQASYIREILSQVRAPITGYMMQEGASEGLYSDGWTGGHIALRLRPLQPVTALRFKGWRPDHTLAAANLTLRINGGVAAQDAVRHGVFEMPVFRRESPLVDPFLLEVEWDSTFRPEEESRDLAFVLMEIRAEHG